jgi:gluconokinase
MGVSGSGKTTIASLLATKLAREFADADDFHSAANVAKMARGEPLTDADREPWLRTLAEWIAEHHRNGRSTVLACSALKRGYRDVLRSAAPGCVSFLHLAAARATLEERMRHRKGHYMPADLLESQLAALELLQDDEPGVTLDAAAAPETIVEHVLRR